MAPRALIIDCDPGVDDAVALFLAFAAAELEVVAVTTVAGNVAADLTARNARIVRQLAGAGAPVFAGATGPLLRRPVEADHFHGESGLGDLPLFEPDEPLAQAHSALAIIEAVMTRPAGTVSVAVLGPMTNLALALRLEPAIAGRLGDVVVMGGARSEGGNITPTAEYNVFADPHAAQIVLDADVRPLLIGLDATHQVRATPARIAALEAISCAPAQAVAALLRFSARVERRLVGDADPPLHDPCTIAWLLAPDLFEVAPCRIQVETASPLTLGCTAVEFRLTEPAAGNARWATRVDADGVFALLTERLARA